MSRVLITGASRGIGRGIAVELTARGHEVIATARDVSMLRDVPAVARLRLDVTDPGSVAAAVAEAGTIDVLVSNAGATVRAPLETVPIAEVQQLFDLNTFGALRVAQEVLPGMRERGSGRLIFISSIQGRIAIPLIGPYAASKWALEAIAETLAIEVGHFGISVQLLQPGAVSSGGGERAKVFLDDSNPYRPLLDQLQGFRSAPVAVEAVAEAVAATLEDPQPPLRIPVGDSATKVLAARKAAPEDVPFLAAPLDW
jgi:NAD(P)-dependent dehydrogenase (short-subunit alcohol dehydrogenase family)